VYQSTQGGPTYCRPPPASPRSSRTSTPSSVRLVPRSTSRRTTAGPSPAV
jgi:hypothetical protein